LSRHIARHPGSTEPSHAMSMMRPFVTYDLQGVEAMQRALRNAIPMMAIAA